MQIVTDHHPLPEGALVFANDDDVLADPNAVAAAAIVVLQFPKWTDGRAYSQAVLLRGRLRYGGEIRATGDVVVDMLPLLRRCGFDSVRLRDDQNRDIAERTLDTLPGQLARATSGFPGQYQADAAGGRPLWA